MSARYPPLHRISMEPTADRPHFYITYATKSLDGLKEFRETEYRALREHARSRANAKERKREDESSMAGLFPGHDAEIQEETIEQMVAEKKAAAAHHLMDLLSQESSLEFTSIVLRLLRRYPLRETNVKDVCVALARAGEIENTWGGGNRKPKDGDIINRKKT